MNDFQILDKTIKMDFATSTIQEKFDSFLVALKLQGYKLTTDCSDGTKFTVDGKKYSFCPFTQIFIKNEEKTCAINFMLNDDKSVNYIVTSARLVDEESQMHIEDSDTEEKFNKALDQLIKYL